MDESPKNETAGEQPTAGTEAARGQDPAASQTQEGASSTGGQPAEGSAPAGGGPDVAGEQGAPGTSGSAWESSGWKVRDESARDWVGQLQGMIDSVTEHAGPVLREVAAKAAELAAVAAENAGPALQRAADMTTEVGHKVAARSKEYAAELRRQQSEYEPGHPGAAGEPAEAPDGEPPTGT